MKDISRLYTNKGKRIYRGVIRGGQKHRGAGQNHSRRRKAKVVMLPPEKKTTEVVYRGRAGIMRELGIAHSHVRCSPSTMALLHPVDREIIPFLG